MACTGIAKRVLPRFGEFCYCCCLPLLPQLAYSILATWEALFWRPLYGCGKEEERSLDRALALACLPDCLPPCCLSVLLARRAKVGVNSILFQRTFCIQLTSQLSLLMTLNYWQHLQGWTKRLRPGLVNMRRKNCVLLPAAGR